MKLDLDIMFLFVAIWVQDPDLKDKCSSGITKQDQTEMEPKEDVAMKELYCPWESWYQMWKCNLKDIQKPLHGQHNINPRKNNKST